MATLESTQIRVLVDSVQDSDTDEPHNEQHVREEQTALLGKTQRRKLKLRSCCVKSKAALLVLCWNTLVTVTAGYVLEYGSMLATNAKIPQLETLHTTELQILAPTYFGFLALLYLFYPLAGCLADIRCGRYRTITNSLWFITWGGVFTWIGTIILACYFNKIISPQTVSITVLLVIGFGLSTFFGMTVLALSYISLKANIIQFGMDQLHDSPAEDSILFIHWFVFTSHLGAAINKFVINSFDIAFLSYTQYIPEFIAGSYAIPIVALVCIGITAWIARRNRQWFMIDSGSRNPYKLVYKVIKFAAQHKSPIRRSAFTYCEDELPSRMDLAKEKYGGPFTTEQVEDVKAFLGILSILLTFASVFITEIATSSMLLKFSRHFQDIHKYELDISKRWYLFDLFTTLFSGGLTETLIIIFIPLYLCLLRPFIHCYIPGMLKCIGLGMIFHLLSLLSFFLIDTIGHIHNSSKNITCFMHIFLHEYEVVRISIWYVALPCTLNAISDMLFYIAAYEFICAQSPHTMKGMLIGTFFTVKGVFQLIISVLIILVPFTIWKFDSFPSCGFVYYLVNIIVAVIGLVAYTWVARRYQYRQRDEPDNIYRYAEEYYDRDGDERYQNDYDSSDYDNLNVHTIS